MRKSHSVGARASATMHRLFILIVATVVSITIPTALSGHHVTTTAAQPSSESTQAFPIPALSVDYAVRADVDSQTAVVRSIATQSQLARTALQGSVVYPEYIRVARTSNPGRCVYPPKNVKRVDSIPFYDYVRNVLPNEWYTTWPEAALDAGAVAVAQYAIVMMQQGKWSGQGYNFDVLDSICDQVYLDRSPGVNYSRTDAAVDRMWGITLTRGGQLIPTYYRSHAALCPADCMGQRESRDWARQGMSGVQILEQAYAPVTVVNGWGGVVATSAASAVEPAVAANPEPAAATAMAAPAQSTEYINVGRTFDPSACQAVPRNIQRVDQVTVKEYIRNVLPLVMDQNLPEATLEAGALAIGQYVLATKAEGKWTRFGYSFDVLDNTCDYPYIERNGNTDYSRADAAIERISSMLP